MSDKFAHDREMVETIAAANADDQTAPINIDVMQNWSRFA